MANMGKKWSLCKTVCWIKILVCRCLLWYANLPVIFYCWAVHINVFGWANFDFFQLTVSSHSITVFYLFVHLHGSNGIYLASFFWYPLITLMWFYLNDSCGEWEFWMDIGAGSEAYDHAIMFCQVYRIPRTQVTRMSCIRSRFTIHIMEL